MFYFCNIPWCHKKTHRCPHLSGVVQLCGSLCIVELKVAKILCIAANKISPSFTHSLLTHWFMSYYYHIAFLLHGCAKTCSSTNDHLRLVIKKTSRSPWAPIFKYPTLTTQQQGMENLQKPTGDVMDATSILIDIVYILAPYSTWELVRRAVSLSWNSLVLCKWRSIKIIN